MLPKVQQDGVILKKVKIMSEFMVANYVPSFYKHICSRDLAWSVARGFCSVPIETFNLIASMQYTYRADLGNCCISELRKC